jgi:hypothetical protein
MSEPTKPAACPQCAQLIKESRLELVLCGGLHVGHTVEPKRWLLRSVDESAWVEQRTRDLQRSASQARQIAALETTSKSIIAGLEAQIRDLKLELKMKEESK